MFCLKPDVGPACFHHLIEVTQTIADIDEAREKLKEQVSAEETAQFEISEAKQNRTVAHKQYLTDLHEVDAALDVLRRAKAAGVASGATALVEVRRLLK